MTVQHIDRDLDFDQSRLTGSGIEILPTLSADQRYYMLEVKAFRSDVDESGMLSNRPYLTVSNYPYGCSNSTTFRDGKKSCVTIYFGPQSIDR